MTIKIGFIINPIAGMGGRVGLKGTDGVVSEAIKLGAKPVAEKKAEEMIKKYYDKYSENNDIKWFTCSKDMGANVLKNNDIKNTQIVYKSSEDSKAEDTQNACKIFKEKKVDLIIFCGGDGTARDIFRIIKESIPILGIPSGVKMHSGVFAVNTEAAAKMLKEFINKNLTIGEAEILDLDEELYRKGQWNIKLFGIAKGIVEPTYVQVGKTSFESISDNEIKDEIAECIEEELDRYKEHVFLFGSGGTIDYIAEKLSIDNTLLGIDAVYKQKNIGKDLNEKDILKILNKHPKAVLILSPIGAQGFILGRGNLQLSPTVIKKIGLDNIIVISTPSKLLKTPILRVDTGDNELDKEFREKEFMMVLIGYRTRRVVKIQTDNL